MAHILDPKRLANAREYCAALGEVKQLVDQPNEIDAGSPGGWRFDELALLIHEYESTMRTPGLSWPVNTA